MHVSGWISLIPPAYAGGTDCAACLPSNSTMGCLFWKPTCFIVTSHLSNRYCSLTS